MKLFLVFLIVLVTLLSSCSKTNSSLLEVTVIGHAGISLHRDRAIFPANSFESIQYAIDVLDADGIEVDVQMTKDSILVLFHDKFLEYSTNFNGCVSQYTYDELKSAKLDNTEYTLVNLEKVMKFIDSRKKNVFLDVKAYDFCNEIEISTSAFNYSLSNSFSQVSQACTENSVVINPSISFLNKLNHSNKCIEASNIQSGVEKLNEFGYQSILINISNISKNDMELLTDVNWGVFGVKDEWSIDNGIELLPKFVITDNIAYTKKITN